jgi:hypothetical protein
MAEIEPVDPQEAAQHLFRSGTRHPGVSGVRPAAVSSGTRPAVVSIEAGTSGQRASVQEGKVASIQSRHILWMAFGLPLMTAAISMGSMYLGHLITTESHIPTKVEVTPAQVPVQVNVPQAKPPVIEVKPSEAQVQVHVPQGPAPNVTVTAPTAAPPNITVNPPPATVTVIKEEGDKSDKSQANHDSNKSSPAPATTTANTPAPAPATASTSTSTSTSTDTATPATAPKSDATPKLQPKGNGNSYLPPVHETQPLVNVSTKPDVALVVPLPDSTPEDDTLLGEVLPRTQTEIDRQQADDAKHKK